MSRAGDDFGGPAKERSGCLIPLAVFLVTAVLIGLVLLYYLSPTPSELIEEQTSPTSAETPVTLRVGSQNFHVPANYLPYASARKGGTFGEVKLMALLPDLRGYSSGTASSFTWDDPDSRLLDIRLRARTILDEQGRLDRIYLPQVESQTGAPAPFGLTQYTFRANSSYRDVELYVGQSETGPVILRCSKAVSDSVAGACLREWPVAQGVAFSYRFKRAHLANWREIDAAARTLLASFMAK
jgi:hypothetical protein